MVSAFIIDSLQPVRCCLFQGYPGKIAASRYTVAQGSGSR